MFSRYSFAIASFLGFTGVALGAFGAHALREHLASAGMTSVWDKAVLYHLLHAAVVFGAGVGLKSATGEAEKWLRRAALLWVLGVLFFSGSLYLLALGGPRWIGPITPLGGLCLLSGWLCVALYGRHHTSGPGRAVM